MSYKMPVFKFSKKLKMTKNQIRILRRLLVKIFVGDKVGGIQGSILLNIDLVLFEDYVFFVKNLFPRMNFNGCFDVLRSRFT